MTVQQQIDRYEDMLIGLPFASIESIPYFAVNEDGTDFAYDSDGLPIPINSAAMVVLDNGKNTAVVEVEEVEAKAFRASIAMSPWEFIANKNAALTRVCMHRNVGEIIMSMLQGIESWALDHKCVIDEVQIVSAEWTYDGRLIFSFKADRESDYHNAELWTP